MNEPRVMKVYFHFSDIRTRGFKARVPRSKHLQLQKGQINPPAVFHNSQFSTLAFASLPRRSCKSVFNPLLFHTARGIDRLTLEQTVYVSNRRWNTVALRWSVCNQIQVYIIVTRGAFLIFARTALAVKGVLPERRVGIKGR